MIMFTKKNHFEKGFILTIKRERDVIKMINKFKSPLKNSDCVVDEQNPVSRPTSDNLSRLCLIVAVVPITVLWYCFTKMHVAG